VFGQSDFVTATGGSAGPEFDRPEGIHVDDAGCLWVADTNHHRVPMYFHASSRPGGASLDGLLGSPAFDLAIAGNSASHMMLPRDVAMDASGRPRVADWDNHRVLRFDDAVTKALANGADPLVNTAAADGLLGQTDFGFSDSHRGLIDATAATMNRPWKLEVDPADNLWVSDTRNDRLFYFINPGTKANGADALANAADPPSMQPFPAGSSGSRLSIAVFSPSPPTDLSPRLRSRSRPAAISGS